MSATEAIAVIGAGWAGLAAAARLSLSGRQVHLYERSRSLGGRARSLELPEICATPLDNGQHILLGAYRHTLQLLQDCGVNQADAFLRLPLQFPYPGFDQADWKQRPFGSGMLFEAPAWPAPLHLLAALLKARGLNWEDKLALSRFSSTARWMDWDLQVDCSVTTLLERYAQTPNLYRLLWRPLCLAALNTPPEWASARVFLHVLRDSLGAARRQASDMLLPRRALGALLPQAVESLLKTGGASIFNACAVRGLQAQDGVWLLHSKQGQRTYSKVLIATDPWQGATLLQQAGVQELAAQLQACTPRAIATCYLRYAPELKLARPFYALCDTPEAPGQFVFDRGWLDPAQAGVLAVVISAAEIDAAALPQQLMAQLAAQCQMPELRHAQASRVICEKRATFNCEPESDKWRPAAPEAAPGLWLAGDWLQDPKALYPATLEGAVRSGEAAAKALLKAAAAS
ncbi:hydroxysqualene dehydroxylase HpnE [Massilia sp. W12]|uniref:hydroxysqualene dehydroxylase HpnE n=1 Tax=Massilia sp. W12 TaxID=3126507 RepID=UPI0030D2D6E2